jgi:hypothetical protein
VSSFLRERPYSAAGDTPTFFINGQQVAFPYQAMATAIQDALGS